jgi:hypothetical protein
MAALLAACSWPGLEKRCGTEQHRGRIVYSNSIIVGEIGNSVEVTETRIGYHIAVNILTTSFETLQWKVGARGFSAGGDGPWEGVLVVHAVYVDV